MSRPTILISNDDGIYSDGIYALWESMSEIGETIVVAPNTEKSAVGHAITLSDPIRIEEVNRTGGFTGYAVNGTPADSVKIGVKAIMQSKPDIIISGINHGANVGQSLLYSGTISAATEGTFLRIPSVAISLDALRNCKQTLLQLQVPEEEKPRPASRPPAHWVYKVLRNMDGNMEDTIAGVLEGADIKTKDDLLGALSGEIVL